MFWLDSVWNSEQTIEQTKDQLSFKPWDEVESFPLVLPVEQKEGKGKAEPNANKAQFLFRGR